LFDALPSVLAPHPGVTLAPHFLKGPRIPTLIAFAKAYGAELIAIGRQGRSISGRPQLSGLGPTVRGLLEQAPCSLLVSNSA
jgi:nucleotide-binding universal stress UspA family protein